MSSSVRACSWCGGPIHLCNGAVLAGDALLAFGGQLPWSQVRERGPSCTARWEAARMGCLGPYVWLAAKVHDTCRTIWWRVRHG